MVNVTEIVMYTTDTVIIFDNDIESVDEYRQVILSEDLSPVVARDSGEFLDLMSFHGNVSRFFIDVKNAPDVDARLRDYVESGLTQVRGISCIFVVSPGEETFWPFLSDAGVCVLVKPVSRGDILRAIDQMQWRCVLDTAASAGALISTQ
jgi:hypothetical protein